jgi:hypothetical protein
MIISSFVAYGGTSLPDDVRIEIVGPADTGFSIMELISMAAPIIACFALIALIALAGRYIINKYVRASKKSKIQKFVLAEIIEVIFFLLVFAILALLAKIENPDTSFKEEFLEDWWIYLVVFITAPIISLLFPKLTANWKEWKIFKKWNE